MGSGASKSRGNWSFDDLVGAGEQRILTECPRHGRHVFTSKRKRGAKKNETDADAPLSGFSQAKAELDTAMAVLAKAAGEPTVAPWTIHDLRRTATTMMAKLGVPRFIQKRVLNHADKGIYDIYEYLDEKRRALDAWG